MTGSSNLLQVLKESCRWVRGAKMAGDEYLPELRSERIFIPCRMRRVGGRYQRRGIYVPSEAGAVRYL